VAAAAPSLPPTHLCKQRFWPSCSADASWLAAGRAAAEAPAAPVAARGNDSGMNSSRWVLLLLLFRGVGCQRDLGQLRGKAGPHWALWAPGTVMGRIWRSPRARPATNGANILCCARRCPHKLWQWGSNALARCCSPRAVVAAAAAGQAGLCCQGLQQAAALRRKATRSSRGSPVLCRP
jgi:hypothetical protein